MKKEIKVFSAEIKEFNEADLTVVHFISTERKDRGGDIMHADGMKMTGRPVVLLIHGFTQMGSEPIAKPVYIRQGEFKKKKGIEAKTQFFPDDLGKRLWAKTTQGYMPNWSIGYIVLKWEFEKDGKGDTIRHVTEWELLEYSPVGVPMNPDAQTADDDRMLFKVLDVDDEEEKYGEIVAIKNDEGEIVELKPYPNEHACRINDPGKYIRIRRQNDKFGSGIHAIWGVQGGGKPVELQAIRFDKTKFTAAEARKWCKDHDHVCKPFEPASEKCGKCGKDMEFKWLTDDPENGEYVCHCEDERDALKAELSWIREAIAGLGTSVEKLAKEQFTVKELGEQITALKSLIKPEIKDPAENPPESRRLEFVDDEKIAATTAEAIRSMVKETVTDVVGKLASAELRRLMGKID
jgi:hypothetical protein